jgi:putative transcriptional regulator
MMSSRFIDVRKLRQSLQMSQPQFALRFGFNISTLREWEQGRRAPDAAARTLLAVILHSPETVQQALASAPGNAA